MKLIDHLDGLVSSRINAVKGIWALFRLEAKLAGLTVFPLLVNLVWLLVLLVTVWFSAMALLAYISFYYTGGQTLLSIELVFGVNIALLLIAMLCLKRKIRNLSFEKTRTCLADSKIRMENDEHDNNLGGTDRKDSEGSSVESTGIRDT
ncbi:hypothetical protein ACFORL_01035 [Legionella dresdenensis]|uniref:Transmembrane protein n=1 Tax=Legionella dresdenensis TaxID=450200 RepID=A0ABV8CBK1_9GAMM